jgi:hypothetical protein
VVIEATREGNGNPLSYEHLQGTWAQWYRTAQKFETKVLIEDRGDVRDDIILELARASARRNEPISEAIQCRIAACAVAHYWRTQYKFSNGLDCGSCSQKQRAQCKAEYLYSKCPKALKIESLSQPITDANGNTTELGETITDDKAIDLDAWLDARTFLLRCPDRLIQIANKIRNGNCLNVTDSQYLWRFRKREQKSLISV